jgi:uncharacterized protein YyaL (SSP411 family)
MRDGGFYFVSHEHEPLILRPKPGHDNATPSGNAVAALALLRIGYMLGETRYLASAERALRLFAPLMARRPGGFATMGMALSELLAPTRTVILRGSPERLEPWHRELSDSVDGATLLLALDAAVQALPAVLDKPAPDSGVNAYLCQGVSCLRPVQDMAALRALMDQANSPVTGS